jgi:hypothetical protein
MGALRPLERDDRHDAIGAHELSVAERDHPGVGHASSIACVAAEFQTGARRRPPI